VGRTIAIVQARMRSTRLPGKVLADIRGEPMLARVVERVRMARLLNEVVIGTTTDAADDAVVELSETRSYPIYRGHPTDVLDRYYQAAGAYGADTVVRITADCPLIDPTLIDQTLGELVSQQADFAANRLPRQRTYPIGLDVEVCTFDALARAWRGASEPFEREHVMPYLYQVPGRFKTVLLNADSNLGNLRWTVDTQADLEFVKAVYQHFLPRIDFKWTEVLQLLTQRPELAAINAGVPHRTEFDVEERSS